MTEISYEFDYFSLKGAQIKNEVDLGKFGQLSAEW